MPLQQTSGNATSDAYGGGAAAVANYIEDVFSTYIYTGTGVGTLQTITNGIDLSTKGGLVWVKCRGNSLNNALVDTVRGANQTLATNNDAINQNYSASGTVNTFSTTGFTVGTNNLTNANAAAGGTFASWTFRKQPKFFDIVTYTGNGANRTISHNLGSTPGFIIIKSTTTTNSWGCYHSSPGPTKVLGDWAVTTQWVTDSTAFNNTAPTSSVFSVGTSGITNTNGATYIAYIFASGAGGFGLSGADSVISCGSWTTSDTVSVSVTLGWEPQWVMLLPTSTTGTSTVRIGDNIRGFAVGQNNNGVFNYLSPSGNGTETSGAPVIYPTATGFVNPTDGVTNTTIYYVAIRRGPMKVPTDATKVYIPINVNNSAGTVNTTGFPIDMQIVRWKSSTDNTSVVDRLRSSQSADTNGGISLQTNLTNAEAATTIARAWTNTGFTTGGYAGVSAIYWNFQRAPGFFDEVCYTGTGSVTTINHNLGVVPELMIGKRRNGNAGWGVYSAATGNANRLVLNTTDAVASDTDLLNSTTPTNTIVTLGNSAYINASSQLQVLYLFATCPGVSKVGSYSGTGATQTINCGFTGGARFVLIKRTDSTGDWYVWDTARGMVAGTDPSLLLNTTAAEVNANSVYTTGVGFQIVSTAAGINASGGTYIFLAVA
jgi:hypothetical protein